MSYPRRGKRTHTTTWRTTEASCTLSAGVGWLGRQRPMVPDLETKRLTLARRTEADLEACVAMDSDLEVRRYITPQFRDHFEPNEYRAKLRERISIDAGPGLGWWIIRERGNPRSFHGMVLLIPIALEGPEIEIGWRLPRASWGKGFATEAAMRVVGYAFHDLALSEIIACINPENVRSISIATRLGFLRAGRKRAYGSEFDLYCLRLGKA